MNSSTDNSTTLANDYLCMLAYSLVTSLSSGSSVHFAVDKVYDEGQHEANPCKDILDVNPLVHSLVLGSLFGVGDYGRFEVKVNNKPHDVDTEANSNDVVHLEEKSEGTFFHLHNLGEQLNDLVHTLHAKEDEHKPVDVLHMIGSLLYLLWAIILGLSLYERHGGKF